MSMQPIVEQGNHSFAFIRPDSELFASLYPELAASVAFGLMAPLTAIAEGRKVLESRIAAILRRHSSLQQMDARDLASEVLIRLAGSGMGNRFDPTIASGWTMVNSIIRRVIYEVSRVQARVERDAHWQLQSLVSSNPLESSINAETLELARREYKLLPPCQQFAVAKLYPFLAVSGRREYVDRHRGLRRMIATVRAQLGQP